jgi:hypothetical protein
MFASENQLQQLIHEKPEVILSGIPEVNPQYCPDAPLIFPLGREIPLNSGPIDNMYLDTNAIATFVECKRYSDSRVKREVYSQAINYASDLRSMLAHYTGGQFCDEFYRIIRKGRDCQFKAFQEIIDRLSEDPILNGKHIKDWEEQFVSRLEYNIKHGVFRIVIACAPSPQNVFSYSAVRNLIQLMSFSEAQTSSYDLVLLDIREENKVVTSRIIWRRFALLPQIPLLAQIARDTSAGIEAMKNRCDRLPEKERALLDSLITYLNDNDAYVMENTYGFAIYSMKNKKSLYTLIDIERRKWRIVRHQVRGGERLFSLIETQKLDDALKGVRHQVIPKKTGKGEPMYDVVLEPNNVASVDRIGHYIMKILNFQCGAAPA